MKIPKEARELFEKESLIAFGTADKEGSPNVVPIYWKKIKEDGTILLIDNFMKMSKKNLLENNKVCVSFWGEEAYKLKGTATYHTEGPVYEEGKKFIQAKKPEKTPKGVVEIKVTEAYTIKPGPDAGKRLV